MGANVDRLGGGGRDISARRLQSTATFFEANIIPFVQEARAYEANITYPAGVLCQLVLDDDVPLRDHFLGCKLPGQLEQSTILETAEWLDDNFKAFFYGGARERDRQKTSFEL